jgi:hypothetical protein
MESLLGSNGDILSWDFMSSSKDIRDPLSSSGQMIDLVLFGEQAGRVFPKLPFLYSTANY